MGPARRYYALDNALSSFYYSTDHIVPECTEPTFSVRKRNHSSIAERNSVCSEFSVLCGILHCVILVVEIVVVLLLTSEVKSRSCFDMAMSKVVLLLDKPDCVLNDDQ